jgi:hypothetical protein
MARAKLARSPERIALAMLEMLADSERADMACE